MKIVVVGAGKVGTALTRHLSAENRVTVIDQNPHLVDNIINIYDVMGVCGNGASYDVQKEADVEHTDLLIATTSSDEINILTCLVAKKLGVRHTIARVRNPEYGRQLRFMRSELGLSMAINPEVSMEVNRLDRVVSLEGENEDGEALVEGFGYYGRTVDEVSDDLADRAEEQGYLEDGGTIELSVESDDEEWKVATEDRLVVELEVHLEHRIIVVAVGDSGGSEEPPAQSVSGPSTQSGQELEIEPAPEPESASEPRPEAAAEPAAPPAASGGEREPDDDWDDDDSDDDSDDGDSDDDDDDDDRDDDDSDDDSDDD